MNDQSDSKRNSKYIVLQNARAFALIFFLVALPMRLSASDFPRHKVKCEEREMEYLLFVPPSSARQSLPALLLLHGAGDEAINFIRPWESTAREKKIVLIVPQLPRELSFEPIAPKVFRCLVEDAKKLASLDPRRIYIFGNSMGGYLAYDGALLESNYFAAAAIHAMGIDDDYAGIVQKAARKIPIAIFMGDRDQLVSLAQVRKTRTLLEKSGFPIQYREIPNHGHNYYELSDSINGEAWEFLGKYRLP